MRFAYPLVLLLVPAVLVFWTRARRARADRRGHLFFPGVSDVARIGMGWRARAATWLPPFRLAAVLLAIVALARPQFGERQERLVGEAIDIMLALDVSGSMKAEDFQPNRLEVAKARAEDFILGREGDRIGLVIFAGDSFTKCPLTRDYGVLAGLTAGIGFEDVADPNATALGMAIATAANRLKDSTAKSKVIILLTDGINNAGAVDPLTAAELAEAIGIKIYTIGVGSREKRVPFPEVDAFGRKRYVYYNNQLDEKTLSDVAAATGGLYFRATDPEALKRIYERISDMEKTDIETLVYVRYSEVGPLLALLALLMVLTEVALSQTVLLRVVE